MIFVVCNEKGGVGKSSIAQALAVYLKVEKEIDLLLIDADPQRTSTDWAEERKDHDFVKISCVQASGNIAAELVELNEKYGVIVVDCGGHDSKAMRSALSVGDVAILPFRPKRRDLRVAASMSETISEAKANNSDLMVFSVVTQTPTLPSQGYRIMNSKKVLAELDLHPLTATTRNLNSWDDSEEMGGSVLEYKEDRKGGDDARAVFDEIEEKLNV